MPTEDVQQGTLALMVMTTLQAMGPMHGYGLARRIEQTSGDALKLNQGTLYPALQRLKRKGWVRSEWRRSEHNRRARYYSVTKAGATRLEQERVAWERASAAVDAILSWEGGSL